jgi:hypothetical protein
MSKHQRHEPFNSHYAGHVWKVVRVDGVDYYPVSELPKDPTGLIGFPVPQNTAVQVLKRLLGMRFSSHKILTSLNSKGVVCIDQQTLSLVALGLLKKGCGFAESMFLA